MVWRISQTKLPNFLFSGRLVSLKSKFSCFRRAEKFPTPTRYTIDKLRCLNDQLLPNLTCPSITLIIHCKHVSQVKVYIKYFGLTKSTVNSIKVLLTNRCRRQNFPPSLLLHVDNCVESIYMKEKTRTKALLSATVGEQ